MHVCMCTTHIPGAFRGQKKRVLDPLDLELYTIVSHYEGAGNQT